MASSCCSCTGRGCQRLVVFSAHVSFKARESRLLCAAAWYGRVGIGSIRLNLPLPWPSHGRLALLVAFLVAPVLDWLFVPEAFLYVCRGFLFGWWPDLVLLIPCLYTTSARKTIRSTVRLTLPAGYSISPVGTSGYTALLAHLWSRSIMHKLPSRSLSRDGELYLHHSGRSMSNLRDLIRDPEDQYGQVPVRLLPLSSFVRRGVLFRGWPHLVLFTFGLYGNVCLLCQLQLHVVPVHLFLETDPKFCFFTPAMGVFSWLKAVQSSGTVSAGVFAHS